MAGVDFATTRQSFVATKSSSDSSQQSKKMNQINVNLSRDQNDPLPDELVLLEENSAVLGLPVEIQRDELASIITLFRQRREWERKTAINSDSSFDKILEEEGDTRDKINQFLKLVNVDDTVNMKKLFIHMRRFFSDESDIYLVLEALLRKENISEKLRSKFKHAITLLEETTDSKKLKSGINIALKARRFSSKLEASPAVIRNSYRQLLEDEDQPLDTYYRWIIQYGYEKRDIVLEFMENALLTDIMSLDPSCSKEEFGNLLGRIKQLNILHSTETVLSEHISKSTLLMQLNNSLFCWFQFFYFCIKDPTSLGDEMILLTGSKFKFLTHYESGLVLQKINYLFMLIPTEIFENIDNKKSIKNGLMLLNDINFKQCR